ncbi:MAG: IS1595 family transposase [Proteobacteria bacterium]|nr:IS1595 family transposase [Pseudomonadota bacterium]
MAMCPLSASFKGIFRLKLTSNLTIKQSHTCPLAHKIRSAMKQRNELFTNPVEADETYISRLENRKHSDKKKHGGRGSKGKAPILAIKKRDSKKAAVKVAPDTRGKTLSNFIGSHVEAGNTIDSEHMGYNPIAIEYDRNSVKHPRGEYVDGQIHTNGMELFWSMLKLAYIETYHRLAEKNLPRCADDFTGRDHARQKTILDQVKAIVFDMEGKETNLQRTG